MLGNTHSGESSGNVGQCKESYTSCLGSKPIHEEVEDREMTVPRKFVVIKSLRI